MPHVFPVADTFSPKEGFCLSSPVTADKEFKLILCAKVGKGGRKCLAQGYNTVHQVRLISVTL